LDRETTDVAATVRGAAQAEHIEIWGRADELNEIGSAGPQPFGTPGRLFGTRSRRDPLVRQVVLDLLDGRESEATRLRFVRTRPLPFPPEPLR
jgi:hypothetical protein